MQTARLTESPAPRRPEAPARAGEARFAAVPPLVIGTAIAMLVAPLFLRNFYYLGLIQLVGIYTIVSLGNGLIVGYAGQFTLGQGAVYAVGAYASAILTVSVGLPVWVSILGATLISALIGLVLGLPALRLRTHYLAMTTLGFALVVPQLILNWEKLTGGWSGLGDIPRPALGSHVLTRMEYYYLVAAATVLMLWFTHNLLRSRWRLGFLAIHDSELATSSLGISVYRVKLVAFLIASVLTGFGGALYAHYLGFISPDNFRLDMSIFFLITVVIGGPATLSGPLLGTVIFVFLPELLVSMKDYLLVVYGLLLVISQAIIPAGLVGALSSLWQRLRGRAAVRGGGLAPLGADAGLHRYRPVLLPDSELLRVRGLSKQFGGVAALTGVDLTIRAGTIHALIGPNGSGKTTLLNLISGFYPASSGSIVFLGAERKKNSPDAIAREGIARTFQKPKIFPHLTVLENVMVGFFTRERAGLADAVLWLSRARADRRYSTERAEELLKFTGLYERRHDLAKNLPHGQQRFLEIARALTLDPFLVLLDEPAAGLSGTELEQLVELIARLKAQGRSVLLVEHHVNMVMQLADWITVLNHGMKICEGSPEHVRQSPEVIAAYLGTGVVNQ